MKTASLLAALVLASSIGFAADNEKSDTSSVDNSKNVVTGAHKTVKKSKSKAKDAAGNEATTSTTETTKIHKDGTVDKSKSVETDSTQKSQ